MTFGELEKDFSLPLENFTAEAKLKPIVSSYQLEAIFTSYIKGTEARLHKAAADAAEGASNNRLKITPKESCRRLIGNPNIQLFPEQDPVVAAQIYDLFESPTPARIAGLRAGTGAGKTIYALAIIDHIIQSGMLNSLPLPLPYPIVWFTVKNAVQQTREEIEMCGYGHLLDKEIFVWAYSAATSSFGLDRLIEEFEGGDMNTGETVTQFRWRPMALPLFCVLDEVHCLARETSRRHRAIRALAECADTFPIINTKFYALTATMIEKVNDGRLLTCVAGISYAGQKITWDNFNLLFANIISGSDGPNVPSKASVERYYKAMGTVIRQPPYYPWPCRAINSIRFYDFRTPEDRAYYDQAVDDYLARIEQLGKDTPSDLALKRIAMLQMRKRVEPIRAPQMVDDMVAEVAAGNTALCGCAFVGTVIRGIFYLMDKYGVSREQISVIWGGREDPRPERILTPAELIELVSTPEITAKQLRQLQKQLDWNEDRLVFADESADAQDERHARLKSLGLIGVQSQAIRQIEIDKFKRGTSKYLFFTMQSGGTGLSFPHRDDNTGPRVGIFSPIFSGKELIQALGRAPRRNSISNTRQYIALMRGTIECGRVAEVLDNKLQCLGVETTSKDDIYNVMMNMSTEELRHIQQAQVRDEAKAAIDAQDDRTQITVDIPDEEEEEE